MPVDNKAVYTRKYTAVAASGTNTLGAGLKNDTVESIIATVSTSGANGTLTLTDGTLSAMTIIAANTPVGTYVIPLDIKSVNGAWKVIAGSAATAIVTGQY